MFGFFEFQFGIFETFEIISQIYEIFLSDLLHIFLYLEENGMMILSPSQSVTHQSRAMDKRDESVRIYDFYDKISSFRYLIWSFSIILRKVKI